MRRSVGFQQGLRLLATGSFRYHQFDLLSTLRMMISSSPVTWTTRHVSGHQDDVPNVKLDWVGDTEYPNGQPCKGLLDAAFAFGSRSLPYFRRGFSSLARQPQTLVSSLVHLLRPHSWKDNPKLACLAQSLPCLLPSTHCLVRLCRCAQMSSNGPTPLGGKTHLQHLRSG